MELMTSYSSVPLCYLVTQQLQHYSQSQWQPHYLYDNFLFLILNIIIFSGPCQVNPCQNHGVCARTGEDSFRCMCPTTYTGQYCEIALPSTTPGLYKLIK